MVVVGTGAVFLTRGIQEFIVETILELKTTSSHSEVVVCGALAVQLEALDSLKEVAIAISGALQDVNLDGIDHSAAVGSVQSIQDPTSSDQSDFLTSLQGVVSKLGLFVQIVDKAANVRMSSLHVCDPLLMILTGPSIRKLRVAIGFITVQGTVHYIPIFDL
jgi:hypothetical protein